MDPYSQQAKPIDSDLNWSTRLAVACVVTQYRRYYPTYHIKAKGEVDVALVGQNSFWHLEIKRTGQLRPKNL